MPTLFVRPQRKLSHRDPLTRPQRLDLLRRRRYGAELRSQSAGRRMPHEPVHVVDEPGRERDVVKDKLRRSGELFVQQVTVDLMTGDVPPSKDVLFDLSDIK
jgi:hypothetical protein